jgi:agmatine deiminase
MRGELCDLFGFEEVVFLESLPREPTGHADMFAAFTSPDTIVVGSLDPNTDPHGAEALDRNAQKLSQATCDGKTLNVVRMPMPYLSEDVWPTYTNVIFANGTLLMPVYPGHDPEGRRSARETYERLLPGWEIVELDAEWFLPKQGGPHCVVLNLGPVNITPLKTGSSVPAER